MQIRDINLEMGELIEELLYGMDNRLNEDLVCYPVAQLIEYLKEIGKLSQHCDPAQQIQTAAALDGFNEIVGILTQIFRVVSDLSLASGHVQVQTAYYRGRELVLV